MKLYIIAYDFPPQSNTAAQRPYAWMMFLNNYGVYPIVITRQWDARIKENTVSRNESYELHQILTKEPLKYKIRNPRNLLQKIKKKAYNNLDLVLHASLWFGPYGDLFQYSSSLISSDDGTKKVIITAMPFAMFRIGYLLNKKHKISWIADYRDDWTTTELNTGNVKNILNKTLYKYQEHKWVSTSEHITTVSGHYVKKITKFLGRNSNSGTEITNGFFKNQHISQTQTVKRYDHCTFLYVGSLYDSQNIEPILSALSKAAIKTKIKPHFLFLGTSFSSKRRTFLLKKYCNVYLKFISRVPKEEALSIQQRCHFAVICTHTGLKGIPSSKIYEFVGSRIPTIYFPNDHDIVEATLEKSGVGLTADSQGDLIKVFIKCIKNEIMIIPKNPEIDTFTRNASTKKLAELVLIH